MRQIFVFDEYIKNTGQIFLIDKYKKMRQVFLLLNIKKKKKKKRRQIFINEKYIREHSKTLSLINIVKKYVTNIVTDDYKKTRDNFF